MTREQEEIREQQKISWGKFAGGWKKWNEINMDFIGPVGKEIIAAINPAGTDKILDIAAGTGEPGLTIAGMLQGGKVIITDLSEEMLAIARENATTRGIQNIETLVCDVCELPFPDHCFDAASGRFGFMFFPDMQLAANEVYRVLKKGGLFATAVWNTPDKNFWVTAIMSTIHKNIELPAPLPGAPGMFRCASPGLLKSIFEKAGFINIKEKEVTITLKCGSIENYWNMMTDVGAPIVAALGKADATTRQKIKSEVFELVKQKYGTQNIALDAGALVLAGEK